MIKPIRNAALATCPNCTSTLSRMSFSRIGEHGYRVRRRQCQGCNAFFSTIELPESLAEQALNPRVANKRRALLLAAQILKELAND